MENHILGSIKKEAAKNVAKSLNQALCDYQIYYQNLRGYHWNIKGHNFFSLHEQFEILYTAAAQSIDDVAERILTLGHTPVHTFSDYIEKSKVAVVKDESNDEKIVKHLIENSNTLLKTLHGVINVAEKNEDPGTADMITAFAETIEKSVWMFSSWAGHSVKS